jgi:hypothetical protein
VFRFYGLLKEDNFLLSICHLSLTHFFLIYSNLMFLWWFTCLYKREFENMGYSNIRYVYVSVFTRRTMALVNVGYITTIILCLVHIHEYTQPNICVDCVFISYIILGLYYFYIYKPYGKKKICCCWCYLCKYDILVVQ